MSEPVSLGLFVAFAAGLLSFLSPCVLPLFPSYVFFAGDGDVRHRAVSTGRLCQVIRVADQARIVGFHPPEIPELPTNLIDAVRGWTVGDQAQRPVRV